MGLSSEQAAETWGGDESDYLVIATGCVYVNLIARLP